MSNIKKILVPIDFSRSAEVAAQRAKAKLDATTAAAREAGIAARSMFLRGAPAQTIAEAARREAVSLIVMGTHGRSGVRRLVLGSVAERVSRTAHVPVMTVRGAQKMGDDGPMHAHSAG